MSGPFYSPDLRRTNGRALLGSKPTDLLGFYDGVGVAQPAATRTARQALQDLGLMAAGGNGNVQLAIATFDPTATAASRTIAAHTLGITIPAKAVILGGFIDVITTFTSATDAGTIALSVEGAGDVLAAIAISDATNMWDAGVHGGKPGFPNLGADAAHDSQVEVAALFAGSYVKTSVDRLVTATVAVEALTAGKALVFLWYVQSV